MSMSSSYSFEWPITPPNNSSDDPVPIGDILPEVVDSKILDEVLGENQRIGDPDAEERQDVHEPEEVDLLLGEIAAQVKNARQRYDSATRHRPS